MLAGISKNMYELRAKKCRLRERYINIRRTLPSDIKKERDNKICSLLLSLASYRYSDIILMYFPCKDEVDIKSVIVQALNDGKKVALPKCRKEDRSMQFYFINSLNDLSQKGAFGIPEPSETLPVYNPASDTRPAVCIIPAIVYDKEGFRIGYGKGFYDRYLPSFSGTKIGLSYNDFIIDKVPRGKYDLSADVLITEKGITAINTK